MRSMVKKIFFKQGLSQNLKQIVFNTGWLFADRILQMGLSLFVGIWVTRYLGPDQFGLFNYALAFYSLFAGISNLGLDNIIIRDVVRYPDAVNKILGTAFCLRLIACLACSVIAIALIFVLRPEDSLSHALVGILTISSFFNALPVDVWFQSQVRSKYIIWAKSGAYMLMCVVRVILVHNKAPLIAFAWVSLVEMALSAGGQIIAYQLNQQSMKKWRFSMTQAKSLMKECLPLIISGMVIFIYMRIDQLMLGQISNNKELGIYSAAVKISEMWYFVPAAIVNSVFPSIVQSKELGQELYDRRMQRLFSLMSLLAYGVAIPITFISQPLVTLLYGEEFIAAGSILAVHIWTGLFVSLGSARTPWIMAEGLTKFLAFSSAAGGAVNVVLNYFLIPNYGAMGASVATIIAQIFASYLMHAAYSKTKPIFVMQTRAIFLIDWYKYCFNTLKKN